METVYSLREGSISRAAGGKRLFAKEGLGRLGLWLGLIFGGLWFAGGRALVVVVLGIISVIAGHEAGHFFMAKRSKMKVTDYFVGFGPVIWSMVHGETRYGVRLIPLGGYVKVPGMSSSQVVDEADEMRTYRKASTLAKVGFAAAGPMANIFMAIVLMWSVLVLVGVPSQSHIGVGGLSSWNASPARISGLRVGDQFISINAKPISSAQQIVTLVEHSAGRRLKVVVERNGHFVTLEVTPKAARGTSHLGLIGVDLVYLKARVSPGVGVIESVDRVGGLIGASALGILHVFSPGEFSNLFHQVANPASVSPKVASSRPLSMVGVVRVAVQGANSAGIGAVLAILVSVNVFVGLFNLIPLAPLDGGYIATALYEKIRSRKGVAHEANPRWVGVGGILFGLAMLVLLASTLYLDIVHPIANPF